MSHRLSDRFTLRPYFPRPTGHPITLLGVCVVMLSSAVTSAAPVQWPSSQGGNDHFYEFVASDPFARVPTTWEQARAAGAARTHQGLQGHLGTITSADEQAFVATLRPSGVGYFYLGGIQATGATDPAEGWSWITGEPWAYTNWSSNPREPNDMGPGGSSQYVERGHEQHLTLGTFVLPRTWNDLDGRAPVGLAGYLVEFSVPEPSAALLAAAAGALLCRARKRRV